MLSWAKQVLGAQTEDDHVGREAKQNVSAAGLADQSGQEDKEAKIEPASDAQDEEEWARESEEEIELRQAAEAKEEAKVEDQRKAARWRGGLGPISVEEIEVSPNIKAALNKKEKTYALMLAIAARQKTQRKRTVLPLFLPVVVTAEGVISEGADKLVDVVTGTYRQAQRDRYGEGRDEWGVSLKARVARFRHNFRAQLVFGATAGTAEMMVHAGTEWSAGSSQVASAQRADVFSDTY